MHCAARTSWCSLNFASGYFGKTLNPIYNGKKATGVWVCTESVLVFQLLVQQSGVRLSALERQPWVQTPARSDESSSVIFVIFKTMGNTSYNKSECRFCGTVQTMSHDLVTSMSIVSSAAFSCSGKPHVVGAAPPFGV
jgi:hypothetical protein